MLGAKRRHGVVCGHACEPSVPAVERDEGHDSVEQHERGANQRHGVAPFPGDQVDHVEHNGQKELDPNHAERSPHAHELEVRAASDAEKRARVVPGARAERELEEPADEILERPADHGAHDEDHDDVGLVETVERDGHQNGAEPVDRRERPPEHAGSDLVDAGVDDEHVVDRLDGVAHHAGDDEDPKQVEEIERDVSAARFIAAERSLLELLERLHVAQLALKLPLVGKGRIDVSERRDEQDGGEHVPRGVVGHADQHERAEAPRHQKHDDELGRLTRPASFEHDEPDAEHHERDDDDGHQGDVEHVEDLRDDGVVAQFAVREVHARVDEHQNVLGDKQKAPDDAEDPVYFESERSAVALGSSVIAEAVFRARRAALRGAVAPPWRWG